MSETVTKERLVSVLQSCHPNNYANDEHWRKSLIDDLFPPPFQPKQGQVIAVWSDTFEWVNYQKFSSMDSGKYRCLSGENSYANWQYARPLTQEEIGLI